MSAWFTFLLSALQDIVNMIFSLDVGLGFYLGDLILACLVIGIICSALVVKIKGSHGALR